MRYGFGCCIAPNENKSTQIIKSIGETLITSCIAWDDELVVGCDSGMLHSIRRDGYDGSWKGHARSVSSCAASSSMLVSASRDLTIKCWTGNSKIVATVGEAHELNISAVAIKDTQFASGSRDTAVKIWNLNEDGSCINTSVSRIPRNVVTCLSRMEQVFFQGT